MESVAGVSSHSDDGAGEHDTHRPYLASSALVQQGAHLEEQGVRAVATAKEKASHFAEE